MRHTCQAGDEMCLPCITQVGDLDLFESAECIDFARDLLDKTELFDSEIAREL